MPPDQWPRIKDLPKHQQEPFAKWLEGQTVPMEYADSYYPWDYQNWKRVPKNENDWD